MANDAASMEPQPISSRSGSVVRPRAAPRPKLLERLKTETAAEHADIERAADILNPRLELEQYRTYLERTLGFYLVAEHAFWRMGVWDALGLAASEREKLPILAEDIVLLGNLEPEKISPCPEGPSFGSTAEAVGGAYVLEGSTLGGRVISRHIQRVFGPNVPRSFLECYGSRTAEQWQTFRAALTRYARTRGMEDQVVAGARETFRTFTRWLKEAR